MELLFAYGAGLLTLINPCVLPVLPIVLATALQADPRGPAALAAGMSLSFVVLGVLVASAGYALGITEEAIAQAGAVLMIGFGLILLVPRLSQGFATATAGISARADSGMDQLDHGSLKGQFIGGMLLGAVWSPCVGPTLGGAISLAAQGQSLFWAGSIMLFFAFGVSTIILLLGYGARSALQKRQALLRRIAERSRPVLGAVFIFVGVAILLRWHHMAEAWAVQTLPAWLNDLSVSL
ncbi:thiol:disulfide interchange protein precursor [Pseudoruegeria aquimaris]|uniref:Thiol:disulfide interchange protein n=1 Tax=Pseudoruegeria aquimaris TaxID=393663 RepID=A0A1Y5RXN6_9RHOB|nr:cytochrome c biogenesis CcdA family protein [Pseudoruegeria aquimaris]SLN28029.1 thiol:disulfide interchange protein precursor [Pseudoruegeria aquimaris]